MEPNNYWREAKNKKWEDSRPKGELLYKDDNLLELVRLARGAGIPEDKWNQIKMHRDYSECYYEGDEPSIVWKFPLTIFDK